MDDDRDLAFSIRHAETPNSDHPVAGIPSWARQQGTAEGWRHAAAQLAQCGFYQSAEAALGMVAGLTASLAERADLFDQMAVFLERAGAHDRAQARSRVAKRLRGHAAGDRILELESGEAWVLCRANDPRVFAESLAVLPRPPLIDDPIRGDGPVLAVLDVREVFGALEDFTFVVMTEAGPQILVKCEVTGDGILMCGEWAVQLTRLQQSIPDGAVELALKQLAHVTRWSGAARVWLEDDQCGITRYWASHYPHHAQQLAYCEIDLAQPMNILRRRYRETHRQRVAWGRKHLRVEKVADPASLYAEFCHLYRTGTHLVPMFTPQSLAQDGVHMFAAWDGDVLAAMVVTSDYGKTSYYAAGARMGGSKKPLTHVLIDAAIEDAQARGMAHFSFGVLHLDAGAGEKMMGIADFKRGFVDHLRPLCWVTVWP
ncbi:MAG: GNAT family N-acetyltransferase [Magnetospirillum gryphiswaldense]|nr:GNAT family N-acetyltransferase [Magnetospirillum gryphiswaldense]